MTITGSKNRPILGITVASRLACVGESSRWYGVGSTDVIGRTADTSQAPPNGSRYVASAVPPRSLTRAASATTAAGGGPSITVLASRPTDPGSAAAFFLRGVFVALAVGLLRGMERDS